MKKYYYFNFQGNIEMKIMFLWCTILLLLCILCTFKVIFFRITKIYNKHYSYPIRLKQSITLLSHMDRNADPFWSLSWRKFFKGGIKGQIFSFDLIWRLEIWSQSWRLERKAGDLASLHMESINYII
jgi:hypothetical protein